MHKQQTVQNNWQWLPGHCAVKGSGLVAEVAREACGTQLCHLPWCWLGRHFTRATHLPHALQSVLERPSRPSGYMDVTRWPLSHSPLPGLKCSCRP